MPESAVYDRSRDVSQETENSFEKLADRDLLLKLLSQCQPLVAAATATEALLERFGGYAEAVTAPRSELRKITSLTEEGASLLHCVHSSVNRLASIPLRTAATLSNWPRLSSYLRISMGWRRSEAFRVLFLNTRNQLLLDCILAEGDASFVGVSTRELARKSLEVGATALILLHNHPSGDPTPSDQDVRMTHEIREALALLGIVVHDHIIVGRSGCYSLVRGRSLDTLEN